MLVKFDMTERSKNDMNFRIKTEKWIDDGDMLLEIADISVHLRDDDLAALNDLIERAMAIKGIERRKGETEWPPSQS